MRFSENGYYIERYVKCDNCGVLIYGAGKAASPTGVEQLFCSQWCIDWADARHRGVDEPRIPLQRQGLHETE